MTTPSQDYRSVARVRSALANATVYRVLSQIVGATIYVLLVRIMTEHDYGIYSLFYSIPVVMGAVLSLGLGNALFRFLPEYFARHDYPLARHFVSWALRLRLVITSSFLLVCLVFWESIASVFGVAEFKSVFLIFAGITITHFQCRILLLTLSANLMQQWSSGLSLAFAGVKLAGYVVAAFHGAALDLILLVDLLAYLLWYVALRFAYEANIPNPKVEGRTRFSRDEKKRVVKYAAYYNFNDVGVVALTSTADRLFIAAFLNPVGVGAYAFCTSMNVMIQRLMPVNFFNGVIEPLIFTLDLPKQKTRAAEYFRFLVKVNYLVQLPVFILVASMPTQIIHVVFGGKFIEYEYLLVAAFAFPVSYAFMVPTTMMAQLAEKAGIILASKIFAAYNVVAALALIPFFGVYGAIVATGTANLFKGVFIWLFVRDLAKFSGTGKFFVTQIFLWASCWIAIKSVTSDMGNLSGLAVACAFVGAVAVLGVRLAHFNEKESNLIRKLVGGRVSELLDSVGITKRVG